MAYDKKESYSESLSLFSSLFEDISATNLPAGLSPDNQDIWYLPGSVQTRPAFNRLLPANSLTGNPAVVSMDDFPLPNGDRVTVFVASNGTVYYRDAYSGGVATITTIPAGTQLKMETAFKKLWMAAFNPDGTAVFSDNPFVGYDIPRYWDGQNIYRVTSDPPGAPPSFSTITKGAITLTAGGAGAGITVSTITTSDLVRYRVSDEFVIYYSTLTFVTALAHGLTVGSTFTLTGANTWTGTFYPLPASARVTAVLSPTSFKISFYDPDFDTATNGTIGSLSPILLRSNNTVTATLAAAQVPPIVGSNVQISDQTTPSSQMYQTFGGGNVSMTRNAQGYVTVVLTTAVQNLSPGTQVYITGGDTHYPAGFQSVYQVLSPTSYNIFWPGDGTTAASATPGSSQTQWSGTFQVQTVSGLTFTYYQQGPDGTFNTADTLIATPVTQCAPGPRLCVVLFQMANGYITGPSIPVSVVGSGGSNYLLAGDIPIGPPGCLARILAFTPAFGSDFFYVAPAYVPAVSGNPPVITQGTIVNDNTTTQFLVDFTDQSLTAGVQIDIVGNNLFECVVLAPVLGFIEYAQRLVAWGEINNIKNLINMGFDGGYVGALGSAMPLGWDPSGSTGGTGVLITAATASLGFAYQMTSAGGINDCQIAQSAYQDVYGGPIIEPSTAYAFRMLAKCGTPSAAGTLVIDLYSPSLGGVVIGGHLTMSQLTTTGGWVYALMGSLGGNVTPASLPNDLTLRVYLNGVDVGTVVTIDELEIIDASQPVLAQQARVSYVDLPFSFDAITGVVGLDTGDSIVAAFKQRKVLYFITDEGLAPVSQVGGVEPAGWDVDADFARNCGGSSPCAVDYGDTSAMWAGRYGIQVFNGSTPKKLSQEIQPTWDTINWTEQTRIWLANDATQRMVYIGVPTGAHVTCNLLIPMSYRLVDSAYNVPDPLHVSYTGKMIATDLCRKWTKWNLAVNCGAMCRVSTSGYQGVTQQMLFGGGNGQAFGSGTNYGNLYWLNFAKYTDDDYGVIASYYVTYFFFAHESEDAVPILGQFRKVVNHITAYITGIGFVNWSIFLNAMENPAPTNMNPLATPLLTAPKLDWDWEVYAPGSSRFAIKVAVTPRTDLGPGHTDAYFNLSTLIITAKADEKMPASGSYQ